MAASSAVSAVDRLATRFDYADFFAEISLHELADARVRVSRGRPAPVTNRTQQTLVSGLALRGFDAQRHVLIWADDLTPAALDASASRALALFDGPEQPVIAALESAARGPDEASVRQDAWGDFLVERLVDTVLSAEADVIEVRIRRATHDRRVRIVTSECDDCTESRSTSSLHLQVVLDGAEGEAVGEAMPADPEALAHEAVAVARERRGRVAFELEAAPVVVSGGWGGMWLHEAVGHAFEADVNDGPLAIRREQRVGPRWLEVFDDPRVPGARGSFTFDDEGTRSARVSLIADGCVEALLADRFAARSGDPLRSGNGRRASYRDLPLPRMSNLIMAGGGASEMELTTGVQDGLYVRRFGEGRLDVSNGSIRLVTDRAYRIRDGVVSEPVQPVAIVATPRMLLESLEAAGTAAITDPARGQCRKKGQIIPVSITAPAVRFSPLPLSRTE